ncbi:winged helix-turn-helix domain-containing protein [Bacteroidota bacterium]
MSEFDYKQINDLIHSRIRLAIMSILITVDEIDFTSLKKLVKTTDGNLSVHLKKLEAAGYVSVRKEFLDRKPVTSYSLSKVGNKAFEMYINQLESMIKK